MNPLIKYHGGKFYLKEWIISLFPRNYQELEYYETNVGGGSIILNKEISVKETINDIDPELINIYKVLLSDTEEFVNQLQTYEYNEETFEEALITETFDDEIDAACNEYIIRRMSRGGLGEKFSWSNRERGGKPGDENAWDNSVNNLYDIADRLKYTKILNTHFKTLFPLFTENTFAYIDPPYIGETRTAKKAYKYEMSPETHYNLLERCLISPAKILLSGYNSLLYNDKLSNWNKYQKLVKNHSGQNEVKNERTEVLWSNY